MPMPYRRSSSGAAHEPLPPAPPESWIRRFGRRNLGYVLFVLAVVALGIALEASGPGGPDRVGGVGVGLMLWSAGSLMFFIVNAVLVATDLAKHRSPRKALIACALPAGIMLGLMILAQFIAY